MNRWDKEYVPSGAVEIYGPGPSETYREYLLRHGIAADEVSVQLYERGVELGREGRLPEAARMFREVLLERPNDARVYYNLGNIYQRMDELRRAMYQYQTAVEIDPRYVAAFNNLGVVQEALGYSDRALESYVHAIALGGYDQAHYNLAVLYEKLGDVENAIKEFETYVSLQPDTLFAQSARTQLKKLYRIR